MVSPEDWTGLAENELVSLNLSKELSLLVIDPVLDVRLHLGGTPQEFLHLSSVADGDILNAAAAAGHGEKTMETNSEMDQSCFPSPINGGKKHLPNQMSWKQSI